MSRISKHMKWFIRDLFNLLFVFQYWPREVSKRLIFGKTNELTITLAEEIVQTGFIQRKLHYRFKVYSYVHFWLLFNV